MALAARAALAACTRRRAAPNNSYVRAFHSSRGILVSGGFSCRSALWKSARRALMTTSIAKKTGERLLLQERENKLRAMQNDLDMMKSDIAHFRHHDIKEIKKKWHLDARVSGVGVNRAEAFSNVQQELHGLCLELENELGQAANIAVPETASSPNWQPLAAAAVSICVLGAGGFARWQLEGKPLAVELIAQGRSGEETNTSQSISIPDSGPPPATSDPKDAHPSGRLPSPPTDTGSHTGAKSRTGNTATEVPAAQAPPAAVDRLFDTLDSSTSRLVGAGAVIGVAFGVWWLCTRSAQTGSITRVKINQKTTSDGLLPSAIPEDAAVSIATPPLGPTIVSIATPTQEIAAEATSPTKISAAAAAALASRAAESVFENAPEQSQVWDMSASVRGIAGNVKNRSNSFEKP